MPANTQVIGVADLMPADLRPFARIWWTFDLAPGTAAPWLLKTRQGIQVMIPVSAEVAREIGMVAAGFGYRPMRRKLTNLPEILHPLAVLAITDKVTRPEDHPCAGMVFAR
jgi:hypothetical protein